MIEAIDLTVRRRGRTVLDAVNFDVRPGQVTGVLGGSGAGKTALLRRMVELDRGDGETLFDGRRYHELRHPMREVGLLLRLSPGDPDRTVRGHLRLILATDRRAAREGAMADVRRWSGAAATTGRNASGERTAATSSWHPSSDRGEARRAYSAARDAEADRRLAIAAGSAHASAGRAPDARDRDGGRGAGRALDLTACADLNGIHERTGEPDRGDARGRARGSGRGKDRRFGRDHGRDRHDWETDAVGDACRPGYRESESRRAGYRGGDLVVGIEAARRGRPADRIDAVLDLVGLGGHGRSRLSELTEGMATRLGIAAALLGDPRALLLDCPDRGLEPEGVAWLGALLRAFTAQGRAALVTGADTETLVGMVDRVLLLDSGYLVGTRTAEEVLRAPTGASVVVRSPQIVRLAALLAEAGARSAQGEGACLEVHGLDRARVGDLAFRHGIPIHELSERLTGSDPADLVLAACTGRRTGLVVPRRASPEDDHAAGAPVSAGAPTGTAARKAKSPGVLVPSAARAAAFEPTGTVRLITVPPDAAAPAAHGEQTAESTRAAQATQGVAPGAAALAVTRSRTPSSPIARSALDATLGEGSGDSHSESRAGRKSESGARPSTRSGRDSALGSARQEAFGGFAAGAADLDEGVLAVWAAPVASPDEPEPVAERDGAGESASAASASASASVPETRETH